MVTLLAGLGGGELLLIFLVPIALIVWLVWWLVRRR